MTGEAAIAFVVLMMLVLLGSMPAWSREALRRDVVIQVFATAAVILLSIALFGNHQK